MKKMALICAFSLAFTSIVVAQSGVFTVNEDFPGASLIVNKSSGQNFFNIYIRKEITIPSQVKYYVVFEKLASKTPQKAMISDKDFLSLITSIENMMIAPKSSAAVVEYRFDIGKFSFQYVITSTSKNWIMNIDGIENYYFKTSDEFLPAIQEAKAVLQEVRRLP